MKILRWSTWRKALGLLLLAAACAHANPALQLVDHHVAAHPGRTGVYVLDAPLEALLARAWLVDRAQHSIEVQYFIWSTDNIGILAAEALLRAAKRGVKVRVMVDDMMIDAADRTLLALAQHPGIDIRIYNPLMSVGVPWYGRVFNAITRFRGVNQRMHDKTLVVDGKVGITGGRNMAAEYFDYNHRYNFRDRDVLLFGPAVMQMQTSFERFWRSELATPVEALYDGSRFLGKRVAVSADEVKQVHAELHAYARDPANFAPDVHAAIVATPESFERVARETVWCDVRFISDAPGKNAGNAGLSGGGQSGTELMAWLRAAKREVVIQSPYLVASGPMLALFESLRARGVRVRINTNSLASTDNLPAFSGYRKQRARLLALGIEIYEYRPDARSQRTHFAQRIPALDGPPPIFSLHAKTIVVDDQLYIGTYNLDPRSENLNTEVGAIIDAPALARSVRTLIEADMAPGSSWRTGIDNAEGGVPLGKRIKLRLMQWLPLEPLL